MKTSYTPGPWQVMDNSKTLVHVETVDSPAGDGVHICSVPVASLANACLIAAAPDMLSALHRCISALAANGAPNCEAAKEARAAILKAVGK